MSRIRANQITNKGANGAPNFPNGLTATGIVTATISNSTLGTLAVTGNATIDGNLGVGGTITYEDVARVDATGISTFREGFKVGPLSGIGLTAYKDGSIRSSGIITATTYYGSGSNLTGIDATQIVTGNTSVQTVDTGSDGHIKINTEGSERIRIGPSGQFGIGGATYGSSGQVLTSGGASAAPSWANAPLVAYKAKHFRRDRYSYAGSSWAEIETNFRITHTPAAVGNTIIAMVQIYSSVADGTYGGWTIVTDQGSGSDESMIGEMTSSSTRSRADVLGNSSMTEMIRSSAGGNIWMGHHMMGFHVTENTNVQTYKLFGRMGSGTRYIGDNQPAQFMQIWEYRGNVMQ